LRCSHMLVTLTKWLLIYYSIVEYKLVLRIIYHHLHAAFIVGTITINCPIAHMDLWGYRIYAILTQQSVYFQFSRLKWEHLMQNKLSIICMLKATKGIVLLPHSTNVVNLNNCLYNVSGVLSLHISFREWN
jgi:hypothetical protein